MTTFNRPSPLSSLLLLSSAVIGSGQQVQSETGTAAATTTASGADHHLMGPDDHIPPPIPSSRSKSAPNCPPWTFGHSPLGPPIEHTDEACDRSIENDPERIENLRHELRRSVLTGELRRLKDEATWVCPADDAAATMYGDGGEEGEEPPLGPQSVWLVRNEASTPVSVGWINPYEGNVEVSAFDSTIGPPHADPKAILRPGEWRSLDVFMGHTFQIRELRPVGGGGDLAPGRILLRHRPGPIPVRNRYGGPKACPIQALVDPDPQTESPNERARDLQAELERIEENRRKFRRTDFHFNHRCNSLHRVFANRVGCPVDVYYGGVNDPSAASGSTDGPSKAQDSDAESETEEPKSPNQSNACFERFKFHLGINPAHADDYVDKWDSPVAFEATYLSHKFVARLRHDPSIVVDEVVIDRTVVRDCPDGSQSPEGNVAQGEGIRVGVGRAEVDATGEVVDAVEVVGEKFDAVGEAATRVLGTNFTSGNAATKGANVNNTSSVVIIVNATATATASADEKSKASQHVAAKDS